VPIIIGTILCGLGGTLANIAEDAIESLLASIQQKQLVILCGAGISMAAPSGVPSADALKIQCLTEYQRRALPAIPAGFKKDLESVTEYLFGRDHQSLFVRELVDWRPFHRNPNASHGTIADLVTTGAARFAVTTNFDELVELSAMQLGEDTFTASMNAERANVPTAHSPFIKLHGCARERDTTLWCKSQLYAAPPVTRANQKIRDRILSLTGWLAANLPERNVLMVGFWTDWAYLGQILTKAVSAIHLPSVILVDPSTREELQTKAPALWEWANSSTKFLHVDKKAEDFLPLLRDAFSRNLLTRVLNDAVPGFEAQKGGVAVPPADFDAVSSADLFTLRQDTLGVPSNRIPRFAQPDDAMNAVGRAHLLLRSAGAALEGPRYKLAGGQRVRVVNGRTKQLSQARKEFTDALPAGGIDDDIVICAGATDDGGVPIDIAGGAAPSTVTRPKSTAEWITLEQGISRGLL
jgi:NAD-dependent SIR2 family protein deacetylase